MNHRFSIHEAQLHVSFHGSDLHLRPHEQPCRVVAATRAYPAGACHVGLDADPPLGLAARQHHVEANPPVRRELDVVYVQGARSCARVRLGAQAADAPGGQVDVLAPADHYGSGRVHGCHRQHGAQSAHMAGIVTDLRSGSSLGGCAWGIAGGGVVDVDRSSGTLHGAFRILRPPT